MRRVLSANTAGLTLVELMIAMSVTAMVLVALGAAGIGVQQSYEYSEGYGAATQHAQVVSERITKTVSEATANEQFPGILVIAEKIGTRLYPDVLVVWRPDTTATDPAGLPRMNELVVYCSNPSNPSQLWELRSPSDARTAPAASNLTAWANEITLMRRNAQAKKNVLSGLLRTCVPTGGSASSARAALRFDVRLCPSNDEWSQFEAGTLAWEDMAWVQGVFGVKTGLRQAWMRMEIQLMPGQAWTAQDPKGQLAATFFASSCVYYELNQ